MKNATQVITFIMNHSKAINQLLVLVTITVLLGSNVEVIVDTAKIFLSINIG